MRLPLCLHRLNFVDSKKYPQVQVADLLAGASTYYAKSLTKYGKSDSLSEIIGKSKISNLFYHPLWAEKAFTPEDLNMNSKGVNSIDALVNLLYD